MQVKNKNKQKKAKSCIKHTLCNDDTLLTALDSLYLNAQHNNAFDFN